MLLEQGFLTRITRNHTGIEKHPETLVPFYINYLQNFHKPNLSYLSCILNYIVFWKHKLPEDRQPLTRTTRYRLLLSDIKAREEFSKTMGRACWRVRMGSIIGKTRFFLAWDQRLLCVISLAKTWNLRMRKDWLNIVTNSAEAKGSRWLMKALGL